MALYSETENYVKEYLVRERHESPYGLKDRYEEYERVSSPVQRYEPRFNSRPVDRHPDSRCPPASRRAVSYAPPAPRASGLPAPPVRRVPYASGAPLLAAPTIYPAHRATGVPDPYATLHAREAAHRVSPRPVETFDAVRANFHARMEAEKSKGYARPGQLEQAGLANKPREMALGPTEFQPPRPGSPKDIVGPGEIFNSDQGFVIKLDVKHFGPDGIKIMEDEPTGQTVKRTFSRSYSIPSDIIIQTVRAHANPQGFLFVRGARDRANDSEIPIPIEVVLEDAQSLSSASDSFRDKPGTPRSRSSAGSKSRKGEYRPNGRKASAGTVHSFHSGHVQGGGRLAEDVVVGEGPALQPLPPAEGALLSPAAELPALPLPKAGWATPPPYPTHGSHLI